jgi:hypothetical protein
MRHARQGWGALGVLVLCVGAAGAPIRLGFARTGHEGISTVARIATDAEPPARLWPGSPSADLVLTVTNPGPDAVTFVAMRQALVASDRPGPCPASSVTVAARDGLAIVVPGRSTTRHTVAGAVSMSTDAPDGCQGVAFEITVTLTAQE